MEPVQIINPIELGDDMDDKTFILDININLNNNTIINLEMQMQNERNWEERSLSYLCRSFDQLYAGQEYYRRQNTMNRDMAILQSEISKKGVELAEKTEALAEKTEELAKKDEKLAEAEAQNEKLQKQLEELQKQLDAMK